MNFLKNESIKVIKNFLSITNQNNLEQLLFDNYFPWYTSTDYTAPNIYKNKNILDYSQFVHVFYSFRNNTSNIESTFTNVINENLINHIGKYFNLSELNIMRIKANLQTQHKKSNKNTFNNPHKDSKLNHISAIYYVHNTDGDTYFFNDNLKIIKKVKPEKGSIVFFKGNILHAGGHPIKNEKRVIINCNFLI